MYLCDLEPELGSPLCERQKSEIADTLGGKAPWIVVSGLDGSGKTTLASRLTSKLGARFFRLPFHDF
jgi:adenylylsulfate kinase-like enzyme